MRRRGESSFRIEIFTNIRHGQKDELGTRCPELVLLTVPNILEYFYSKIRFSTPALSALLPLAGQIYLTYRLSACTLELCCIHSRGVCYNSIATRTVTVCSAITLRFSDGPYE